MSITRGFARLAFAGGLAVALGFGGCATPKETRTPAIAPGSVFETAGEILGMPPCEGVVVDRAPCYVSLKTAEGTAFFIGSPASGAEVVRFLEVLKDGRTYKFPDEFVRFQGKLK
jgi:hypothetical protein